jgi:hypothetical protein
MTTEQPILLTDMPYTEGDLTILAYELRNPKAKEELLKDIGDTGTKTGRFTNKDGDNL